MAQITTVTITLDANSLTAVQAGLQALALHANNVLGAVNAQVLEQINEAAKAEPATPEPPATGS